MKVHLRIDMIALVAAIPLLAMRIFRITRLPWRSLT